jgi:DNA-binding transcriptional LysR family regulator
LAAAGLGVTLLPPRCYQRETEEGRLKMVRTVPTFPPVEFTATCSTESLQPLARRVGLMAQQISDFERMPALEPAAE